MKKISRKLIYYAGTILCMLIFLIPLWMVFVNSFKAKKEAAKFSILFPETWHVETVCLLSRKAQ